MIEAARNEATEEKENESEDFRWGEKERGRREQREGSVCEAWERASPLTERGHAVERGFYEAACSCFYPHRKPTPTFTLAARPDDSMLKDGRLAG